MTITVDQEGNRVIPNVAPETSLLIERTKDQKPGFMFTYADLKALGIDVRGGGYGYLASARHILLRDYGLLLETVKGVGVRVANPEQKLDAMGSTMRRIPRTLRKAGRISQAIDYASLPEQRRPEYNARTAVLGSLKLLAAASSIKKVEGQTASGQSLSSKEVLGLFTR